MKWLIMTCVLMMSALPTQAAVPLGVYQGNGCTGVKKLGEFTDWFGHQPDFVLDFFDMGSWQSMQDDAGWTVSCWARTQHQMVFSVPMLPGGKFTLAEGAAGQYDEQFTKIATLLVSRGYGDAVIRLGWEFNGGWYSWAAKKDPANWVAYWQRIVTTMRAVKGAAFRFNWCAAQGTQQIKPDSVYPGDEYVDIIGQDVYNQSWNTAVTTPEQRWDELLNQAYGLKWLREFAQAHNKPISIPEWGTGTRPDGHGGGDDAYFITQLAQWIESNNVAFHGYWDFAAKDFNARLSNQQLPTSGAAFKAAFANSRPAPQRIGSQNNKTLDRFNKRGTP
jgi:Glycosyl hydrolase family 26